jgi:hypothetical protein
LKNNVSSIYGKTSLTNLFQSVLVLIIVMLVNSVWGSSLESRNIEPGYFISNLNQGHRLVDNPDVHAFIQTRKGRILFTSEGAFMGVHLKSGSVSTLKTEQTVVLKSGIPNRVVPRLEQQSEGKVNFLIGPREDWQTGLAVYSKLVYSSVWPNIDLEYLGYMDHLEYHLNIQRGGDPNLIVMETGGEELVVHGDGSMTAMLGGATLDISRPFAYQEIGGARVKVNVSFRPMDHGTYGFTLGSYNRDYPLIIDPSLIWGTYLGGEGGQNGDDLSNAVAVNASGYLYLTGSTDSSNFPTKPGSFQTVKSSGTDAFVMSMFSTGSGLRFSTFIGGSSTDVAYDLVLDSASNICVVGTTLSPDFPVTSSALDSTHNGNLDIFVLKLRSDGSALMFSTYVGGSSSDTGSAIAVDSSGELFVAGSTFSSNFPVVYAIDSTSNGNEDAVVFKLSPDGKTMSYATFLGGSEQDRATSISIAPDYGVFIAGTTRSSDFPVVSGGADVSHNGGSDAFLVRFNAKGDSMTCGTFLGGSGSDYCLDMVSDSSGNTYLCGYTYSTDFPVTPGVVGSSYSGANDGFVAKLTSNGGTWSYATYLGGSLIDEFKALTLNHLNEVIVTGGSTSTDFPVTTGAYDTTHNGVMDLVAVHLNSDATALLFATYAGGSEMDTGKDIVLNDSEEIIITGNTSSAEFPTTAGAMERVYQGGDHDGVILKFSASGSQLLLSSFIGGGGVDRGEDIAQDSAGDIFICGTTGTAGFPTRSGSFDTVYNGKSSDAFLSKFSQDGSSLIYSTFIGGQKQDEALGLAVDDTGRAIVTGYTRSSNFPVTSGSYDEVNNGASDVFLLRLNTAGSDLEYACFIGGFGEEAGRDVVVDTSGNAYVTGKTTSSNFPTTSAYDTSYNQGGDCFVLKMNADGTALEYSTFLGGTGEDQGNAIALYDNAYAIVTGYTLSSNFPIQNAYDSSKSSFEDIFVTRISRFGTSLDYSTFLGHSGHDFGQDIVVTTSGEAIITGYSNSTHYPYLLGYSGTLSGGYDAVLTKLNSAGDELVFSTYLGGSGNDKCYGLDMNSSGQFFLTGTTDSTNFPTTEGAFDETINGGTDIFVTKLAFISGIPRIQISVSTYLGGSDSDESSAIVLAGVNYAGYEIALSGTTKSIDFPTTNQAFSTSLHGEQDALVVQLTMCNTLPRPDPISGLSTVCAGETNVAYEISEVPEASSYEWSVPSGATILTNTGNRITVEFGSSPGEVTVATVNDCGTSTPSSMSVSVLQVPGQPGPISGNIDVCENEEGVSYAIDDVTGATDYQWSVPAGAVIISGQGSTSITVDYGESEGLISVTAGTMCGTSTARTLEVSMNSVPDRPNPITGSDTVCPHQSDVPFSTDPVPGATSYIWSLPAGATISSGSGTEQITVQFGTTMGYVVVVPVNECGQGISRNMLVSEGSPVSINTEPDSVNACEDENVQFSVAATGTGLTYQWYDQIGALSDNSRYTGSLTDTLHIQHVTASDSNTFYCTVTNSCGSEDSGEAVLTVSSVPVQPDAISGPSHTCEGATETYQIDAVESASNYDWSVPTGASIVSGQGTTEVSVSFGTVSGNVSVYAGNSCGNGLSRELSIQLSQSVVLTRQPDSQEICPGGTVEFQVATDAGSASYQWYHDGGMLTDNGRVSGTATDVLQLTGLVVTDEGNYSCTVQTACDSVNSSTAVLTVDGPLSATLSADSSAMGLSNPSFSVETQCAVPEVNFAWSIDPHVTFTRNGNAITLMAPPVNRVTVVTVVVDDQNRGESVTLNTVLLYSDNPLFLDYNQDGCNTPEDLYNFSADWRMFWNGDPNSDGFIDVRDFLFIDTHSSCP